MAEVHKSLKKPNVILYLKKCFNYALDQNKHYSEATSLALLNITDHVFGDHEKCGTWCQAKDNPKNYHHKSLPNGKPLTDFALKIALQNLLKEFTTRVMKIAHGSSSQPNEAFNHMVATKAPKSRHYTASKSHQFRPAAASCQQNLGAIHILSVKEKTGLPLTNVIKNSKLKVTLKRRG